jgi:hypothetical protein
MLVIITTPLVVSTDPDKRVEVKVRYEGKITNLFSTRKHIILIMLDEAYVMPLATSKFKVSNPLNFKIKNWFLPSLSIRMWEICIFK